jgi:hypothetical protein
MKRTLTILLLIAAIVMALLWTAHWFDLAGILRGIHGHRSGN